MNDTVTAAPRQTFAADCKHFFFADEIQYGMALTRISIPYVLLVEVVLRWRYARELFSTDGALATLHSDFGQHDLLPQLSAPLAVALFTALGVMLVTSLLGWCTRLSLVGSCVLYFYFSYMDCLTTGSKCAVISQHVLLLLALSNCGNIWSIDAWIAKRRGIILEPRASIWPQRLAQILFGMIYFGAGITKLQTEGFLSGDQLTFWMMTDLLIEHPLGEQLTRYPLIVSICCYTTFLWEITFAFTVFRQKVKWWILAVGTIFHIMTIFTLGLVIFPLVMSASYLVFLSEDDVQCVVRRRPVRWLARLLPDSNGKKTGWTAPSARRRFGSHGAFAITLIAICLVGVIVEYRMDLYQLRGPGGPLPLRKLANEEVQKMMKVDLPLRERDKLMAFDLGSVLVGEHLASHRTQYHLGETFVAQVSLIPPHGDMWLDCMMCEAEQNEEGQWIPGRILYRTGQAVLRKSLRTNFLFKIDDEIAPGEYFLKLRSANQELGRKSFTVLPAVPVRTAAAN